MNGVNDMGQMKQMNCNISIERNEWVNGPMGEWVNGCMAA